MALLVETLDQKWEREREEKKRKARERLRIVEQELQPGVAAPPRPILPRPSATPTVVPPIQRLRAVEQRLQPPGVPLQRRFPPSPSLGEALATGRPVPREMQVPPLIRAAAAGVVAFPEPAATRTVREVQRLPQTLDIPRQAAMPVYKGMVRGAEAKRR